MHQISQGEFRENLNTVFLVKTDNGDVDLELTECNDLGTTARQEQFALLFRGPINIFLEQATYDIEHEKLGDLAIFLVPVRRDDEHFYYEAVFNRFITSE